jgi:predicted Zn-ribbon and HTH transcriptional regulator
VPTRRQRLVELLESGAWTAKDLAREMGMRVRDVVDDLEHVRRSQGRAFHLEPAVCSKCERELTDRRKLSTPSRCPDCKSERVLGPWMHIDP